MKKLLLLLVSLGFVTSVHAEMRWLGDVDGDGNVSIKDLAKLINVLAKKDPMPSLITVWDVNEDGVLTVSDVQVLVDIITGKQANKQVNVSESIGFGEKGAFDAPRKR